MDDEKKIAIALAHKLFDLKLGTRWREPMPKVRPKLTDSERNIIVKALEQFGNSLAN